MAARDTARSARGEFAGLQTQVLEWYGVEETQRYVDIAKPATRIHVIEAAQ